MKQEIERKFLVKDDSWRVAAGPGKVCCQGYLTAAGSGATVRVRLIGGDGFLTIKGPAVGISRPEMEYPIPASDAEYMLTWLCAERIVSKVRYILERKGLRWEIDEFVGLNQGLVIAEIELDAENQVIDFPEWIGAEVSSDSRYRNSELAANPFTRWQS